MIVAVWGWWLRYTHISIYSSHKKDVWCSPILLSDAQLLKTLETQEQCDWADLLCQQSFPWWLLCVSGIGGTRLEATRTASGEAGRSSTAAGAWENPSCHQYCCRLIRSAGGRRDKMQPVNIRNIFKCQLEESIICHWDKGVTWCKQPSLIQW